MDPSFCLYIFLGSCSLFPEGLSQLQLFWLVRVLRLTVLAPVWTVGAVLTAVPGCGHFLPLPELGGLSTQKELPSVGAGKAVASTA